MLLTKIVMSQMNLTGLKNLIAVSLLLLLLDGCAEKQEVLVKTITFEPASVELFVGDFKRVTTNTFPHFADNESELDFFMTDKTVAVYDGTTVVGLDEGRSEIVATCGTAEASCPVRVFAWRISLEGVDYGVSKSAGRINHRTIADELEIELSHDTGEGLQQFSIWIRTDLVGQDIDFNKPVEGVTVAATYNVDENGFAVSAMNTGIPLVFNADWTEAEGVSVAKGNLRVNRKGTGNTFTVKANFKLSNGFAFSAEWEGKLPVTF